MRLFDTHVHLDQEEFDEDRQAVIAAAAEVGVAGMVAVGITAESSTAGIQLAKEHASIHAAVGIHPNYAAQADQGDWECVVQMAASGDAVALGETGLDRYWDYTPFDIQQDYFDRHLRLMQATGLPIVIHSRDCDADLMPMLREARERGPLQGIMHSFASTQEIAEEGLSLGLHISFSGMVTYKKNDDLRAVAASIPDDKILIETDSPYLSPEPHRGKRNEPANVLHTAARLAEVRGMSLDDFTEQTTRNAIALFDLAG
ncbi:MAG: TatD family hydrolase [Pirellulales bacterium]|nr:TatD family hydrolase [Pirellulales bacterium]